ncbi:hypothetical protein B0T19DRAFT_127539 [Cercophora scortea]|uniref:Uncharacterized protein n=1 Tax=Cercophora scortea TaxID=314031 RepID=A0AAE0IYZ0_9PEZI|nr:hypothetical protein B0T19DRAFT_127539 [Cercophora scortea]
MACSRDTSPTIRAHVIAAYSDAELDRYLDEHRLEGGGAAVVDVEDWENLPQSFIQRLKDRAQRASDAPRSRPIDLDQVTARLLATTGNDTSTLPQGNPPEHLRDLFAKPGEILGPTPPPIPLEDLERDRYHELVLAGGRPLYEIELIDEVSKDPETYREMLRPWVRYPDAEKPWWEVFARQSDHWDDFRRWQVLNRNEGRPRYVVVNYRYFSCDHAYNNFVWYFRRESPDYTEAAKKLLAEYGFTRPFQLQDDPKQQDKLTTWIEYLGYAYAVHHRCTRFVEKLRPDYDKAWKTLVDLKVLRPSDTDEYVCDLGFSAQCDCERERAEKAVGAAEAALVLVQETGDDPRGSPHTPTRLQIARSRLDAAKQSLNSIKRRNEFVTDFKVAARDYLNAKHDTDRHSAKMRWILEQVPVVEAEWKEESGAAEESSQTPRGTKRRLTDDRDDEVTNHQDLQEQWSNGQIGIPSDSSPRSALAGKPSKRSRRDETADDERPLKRLRQTRSSGLTEVTSPDQTVTRSRSRESVITPVQTSTPDQKPNGTNRAPPTRDHFNQVNFAQGLGIWKARGACGRKMSTRYSSRLC